MSYWISQGSEGGGELGMGRGGGGEEEGRGNGEGGIGNYFP